jgi:hypothetical protein
MVFFGCLGALGGAVDHRDKVGPTPWLVVMLAGFVVFVWGIVLWFRRSRQRREEADRIMRTRR